MTEPREPPIADLTVRAAHGLRLELEAVSGSWVRALLGRSRGEAYMVLALAWPQRRLAAMIAVVALLFLPLSDRASWYEALLSLVLVFTLALLVVADHKHMRLPDALTLPLIGLGILAVPPLSVFDSLERLAAAALAFALLYSVAAGYRRWRGVDGLGLGDAKLFAAAGAWCSFAGLPLVMLIATLLALLLVVAAQYSPSWLGARANRPPVTGHTRIAFGPFLAVGFWFVWLFGPSL